MNEQEIDALEGRQLDLAIERYVFGNEKPTNPRITKMWQLESGKWYGEFDRGYSSLINWPPEYHSSVYLAFKVVDKIEDFLGLGSEFTLYSSGGGNTAQFLSNFGFMLFESYSESRPVAICRAALKVVSQ
jgi:hypothetical protein